MGNTSRLLSALHFKRRLTGPFHGNRPKSFQPETGACALNISSGAPVDSACGSGRRGGRRRGAAGVSGLAASVVAGASLLGMLSHARATDIYTASYGGTNDTGGGAPITSGTFTLNTFTITGIYTAGSSTTETLFITDGTANGRLFGADTLFPSAAVGKQATATVTDSVYQNTEEFKPTAFTLGSGAATTVTPASATASQVAATINGTANAFTAGPADSLYASEGKLLLAPVTFSFTPTTSGTLSTTTTTALTDSAGDLVNFYKSASGLAYTAGKTYTVTGFEQPFPSGTTTESEIVGTTGFTLYTPPATALYRQTPSGSWVPSGGTDWSATAAGPGNTGWINDGSITAFFQKTPTAAITINGGNINAAGLEFDVSGYNIASDGAAANTLTLDSAGLVTVTNATDTATISAPIAGTVGLLKSGAGTLVLSSTTSTFTGSVTINTGTLSVSSDANLGNTANGIVLSGGTLQATANFTTARAVSGSGSVDVAPGNFLVSTGAVSTSALTLTDTGTLDLQGATPSVGVLTVNGAGSLQSTTGSTVTFTGLTAPNLTGTATIGAALNDTGTTSVSVNVGAGGDLVLTNTISTPNLAANTSLSKTGTGTLELDSSNTGLFRVQIGSASATSTTPGGTVVINNPNSLGTNPLFLNSGTLSASKDLTSANSSALPIGISIGGLAGSTTATPAVAYVPATITGSNVEFAGASAVYESGRHDESAERQQHHHPLRGAVLDQGGDGERIHDHREQRRHPGSHRQRAEYPHRRHHRDRHGRDAQRREDRRARGGRQPDGYQRRHAPVERRGGGSRGRRGAAVPGNLGCHGDHGHREHGRKHRTLRRAHAQRDGGDRHGQRREHAHLRRHEHAHEWHAGHH